MARAYPALALRLAANVAALVQHNAQARPSTRHLKAICLLTIDPTNRTREFCRRFIERLGREGDVLFLEPERLGDLGAPIAAVVPGETVPPALSGWLHDREEEFRYLVYPCGPDNLNWARFALRQSDMVLFVGDTAEDPALRDWERHLDEASSGAIARRMLILLQPAPGLPIRDTAAWLQPRPVDFHLHVRDEVADEVGRVARVVAGQALGLVLAGGAARGFAHLGVYRALMERNLPVDWIGGTSLGGIMGAVLASPYGLEEAIAMARESFVKGKPFSDLTLPVVSLIRGRRMERLLREHLDLMIEDLPTPFFCVSCHLDTGAMRLHERGYLPDALRASAAIPGIIPPAVVDGRLAVDGAVINNLPVDVMRSKPVGTVVAVDLSSDQEVPVDYDRLPSPWAVLRGRYLPFAPRYRVPGLSTVLLKATELGTLERVRRQSAQADLVIRPAVRQFGMTEVKAFDRIVEAGYEQAKMALDAWLEQRPCP
jgi:predicted acylesterase/phospholipase RssA